MKEGYLYLIVAAVAGAIAVIISEFKNRSKNRLVIEHLNRMLDAAMNHTFTETTYDETKLSQLETKLGRFISASTVGEQKMSREKDQITMLISDISHQTKTPIANILLYVQLLQEQQLAGNHDVRDLTDQIMRQSNKLNFLIQSLIKTSRIETGIIHVNPRLNSISNLIKKALVQVEDTARLKHIHLTARTNESSVALFDPKWTEEALLNLLDNSIKYTPQHGAVCISNTDYELFSRIDITDNGIGVDEQEINLIFKRFYRSPHVSQMEGVGIGLYLAREIMIAQKGYIKVTSVLSEGSTFSIFLPR